VLPNGKLIHGWLCDGPLQGEALQAVPRVPKAAVALMLGKISFNTIASTMMDQLYVAGFEQHFAKK
jgi:hypothetical protein